MLEVLYKILNAFRDPGCSGCRNPLPMEGRFCRECMVSFGMRPNSPMFHYGSWPVFAATRFTSRTKRLIYGYKFYERRQNLRQMETLLTHYWIGRLAKQFSDFDRICWIPLPPHAGKDSHLLPLAKRMASRIPDSTVSPLLAWRWETKFQHHLKDKQSRIDNLTDCFKLDIKALQEWERKNNGNGRVLWVILDDIVTTGTTMRQAVKALQEGLRLQSGEVSGQIMGLSLTQVPLTSQSLLAESFQ